MISSKTISSIEYLMKPSPSRRRRFDFRFLEIDFFYRNITQFRIGRSREGKEKKSGWKVKRERRGWGEDDRWPWSRRVRGIFDQCEVEHRFAWASVFYYVPNALRDLSTFRDENLPVSCGNRIFSTAFSSASLLRDRERKKKKMKSERDITLWTACDESFATSLVACSLNNLFFVYNVCLINNFCCSCEYVLKTV